MTFKFGKQMDEFSVTETIFLISNRQNLSAKKLTFSDSITDEAFLRKWTVTVPIHQSEQLDGFILFGGPLSLCNKVFDATAGCSVKCIDLIACKYKSNQVESRIAFCHQYHRNTIDSSLFRKLCQSRIIKNSLYIFR